MPEPENPATELDNQPVVEVINQLFGGSDWQNERPVICNLTIGINHGERYGPPREEHYVNRLIPVYCQEATESACSRPISAWDRKYSF